MNYLIIDHQRVCSREVKVLLKISAPTRSPKPRGKSLGKQTLVTR